MNHRNLAVLVAFILSMGIFGLSARGADIVTDWNVTLNQAIVATPSKHNPGNSTRGIAMMNAAIYDVFQAIDRTHAPFKVKVNPSASDANLDAAVAQAAYRTIVDCFGEQQATVLGIRDAKLLAIPDGPEKTAGIELGNYVAQHYIDTHAGDGHDAPDEYTETDAPGHWSSDPLHPGQKGWGEFWGDVDPWAMTSSDQFDNNPVLMQGIPDFGTLEYQLAFNQVKDYGALNSAVRDSVKTDQTEIGLFWAYDRPNLPGMTNPGNGPPPVLFIENLIDIASQAGNTESENARMFALASVAMADAAIASWDLKFETDFWRPVTAIRADTDHDDDDAVTVEDENWVPLGAPMGDHSISTDDLTPPFPAYTSGHATMGGAVFKALELFYGTNDWSMVDGVPGGDLEYTLDSAEAGGGGTRPFTTFTQTAPLTVGTEDSPEGENAISRIYLGIHWLFDGTHGIVLGNEIANYAYENHFQAVPEPSSLSIALLGLIGCASRRDRRFSQR